MWNRYSFTDLSEVDIRWIAKGKEGKIPTTLAPGAKGELAIPVTDGLGEGDVIMLEVKNAAGELINTLGVHLGKDKPVVVPQPTAGAPEFTDDSKKLAVKGNGFAFTIDRATANLSDTQGIEFTQLPALHLTRYDFGDLMGPSAIPYELLPHRDTRVIESISAQVEGAALRITIRDRYEGFAGSVSWLIDKNGMGKVTYDYTYSGSELAAREVGVRCVLKRECDDLSWRGWSEWDVYPSDSISRTEGTARPWRPGTSGADKEGIRPDWPWALDQTERGTADFRSVKLNVYEAALRAPAGPGLKVHANRDAHVRACVDGDAIDMHILSRCRMAELKIKEGDRINGEFTIEILHP